MADNGQMIIDLDRKRMTAMAEQDIPTLRELLADDLTAQLSAVQEQLAADEQDLRLARELDDVRLDETMLEDFKKQVMIAQTQNPV